MTAKSHMKSAKLVRGAALPRAPKCGGHLVTYKGNVFSITKLGCGCGEPKKG